MYSSWPHSPVRLPPHRRSTITFTKVMVVLEGMRNHATLPCVTFQLWELSHTSLASREPPGHTSSGADCSSRGCPSTSMVRGMLREKSWNSSDSSEDCGCVGPAPMLKSDTK